MKYFLCLIFSPLAVLFTRPAQAPLNLILYCCGIIPGVIHGLIIISKAENEKQTNRIIEAIKSQKAA